MVEPGDNDQEPTDEPITLEVQDGVIAQGATTKEEED